MHRGRIFVPTSSALWLPVLDTAHDADHEGAQKTGCALLFYNPHATKLVREFLKGCVVCQRNISEHLHAAGLMQHLDVPSSTWSDIAMDFVEGFPKVGGKSVVLTVVDRFSKMAHFIALSHPYTTMTVAQAFFDNIINLHSLPCSIGSDRDPVFTSTIVERALRALRGEVARQLRLQAPNRQPIRGDEQGAGRLPSCLTDDRPRGWLRWLPWAGSPHLVVLSARFGARCHPGQAAPTSR